MTVLAGLSMLKRPHIRSKEWFARQGDVVLVGGYTCVVSFCLIDLHLSRNAVLNLNNIRETFGRSISQLTIRRLMSFSQVNSTRYISTWKLVQQDFTFLLNLPNQC